MNYDVVIVGGGLGGLFCGSVLSRKGKKVLIIEQHNKVGGFATNFKRKEFTFDVSLHNMGPIKDVFLMDKIFSEFNLNEKITYRQFDSFQRIIFPEHNIDITKGIENFIEELISFFPDEKNGINELFTIMRSLRKEFDEIESLNILLEQLESVYPMLPIKFPYLVSLVYKTFDDLMSEHITNPQLKGLIGNLWWFYGLPPSKVASILYTVPTVCYYNFSGGNIEGTSQKLSDALSDIIKENGGEILTGTRVNEIIVDDMKAKGVITDKGQTIYSRVVVSNANAKQTFEEMIDQEKLQNKVKKKIARLTNSISALQLYIGLNCNAADYGFTYHNATKFTTYNHEDNYNYVLNGDYEKSFLSITNYSHFDKTVAPNGKSVITALTLDTFDHWSNLSSKDYQEKKKMVTKVILTKIESLFPGISEFVEVLELATPLTMKRYTGSPDGVIYGFEQNVDQSGINRFNPETPVANLFSVGSSIYPGAGYPSVITSGYQVGNLIDRHLNSNNKNNGEING